MYINPIHRRIVATTERVYTENINHRVFPKKSIRNIHTNAQRLQTTMMTSRQWLQRSRRPRKRRRLLGICMHEYLYMHVKMCVYMQMATACAINRMVCANKRARTRLHENSMPLLVGNRLIQHTEHGESIRSICVEVCASRQRLASRHRRQRRLRRFCRHRFGTGGVNIPSNHG